MNSVCEVPLDFVLCYFLDRRYLTLCWAKVFGYIECLLIVVDMEKPK